MVRYNAAAVNRLVEAARLNLRFHEAYWPDGGPSCQRHAALAIREALTEMGEQQ